MASSPEPLSSGLNKGKKTLEAAVDVAVEAAGEIAALTDVQLACLVPSWLNLWHNEAHRSGVYVSFRIDARRRRTAVERVARSRKFTRNCDLRTVGRTAGCSTE